MPADLTAQVLELLTHGGGLGTIFGYTDDEYEALYALGHSHYAQQRYLDAAKCFCFLVANQPLEARSWNAYASCMQMLRRYRDAIQYYSNASVLDLEDPLPTFHTAECFIALEMPQEAHEALALVMAQCGAPQWDALRQRAQALMELLGEEDAPSRSTEQMP